MTDLVQRSADVYFNEIDLSSSIRSRSASVGAIVFVSKKGRLTPFRVTTPQDFITEYGIPDAQVSFAHYCALDFLTEGRDLWCLRVANAPFKYAGVLAKDDGLGVTSTTAITGGIINPALPPWSTLVNGAQEALFVVTPKSGPGSYANTLAVRLRSDNLAAATNLAVVSSNTGGILPAASYQYSIGAISRNGETLATLPATVVVSGPGTTNLVTVTWTGVPDAIGYNVYGRTAGSLGLIQTVGAQTFTFIDDGTFNVQSNKQPITSPVNLATPTTQFDLEVYDTTQSVDDPVETWTCTLSDYTDANGRQLEIVQQVNAFSDLVNVTSNVHALPSIPYVKTTQLAYLSGGDSGPAPTNGQIALAWTDNFIDPEAIQINILINGGYTDTGIQRAMDRTASTRGDATAILDFPPAYQKAQGMIDYRNLVLNMNSNYSAIYGPDIFVNDPYNGKKLYTPASGQVAAVYARTDRVAGPQYAPAGLNRAIIDVEALRYKFNQSERTLLFQAQCNYIRTFIGAGNSIFEQVTLQNKISALSWVNVRRMVNVIKASIKDYLQYSLHEPNDDFLRKAIVQTLSDYLQSWVDGRGILEFKVEADNANNPDSAYNLGILNVTVFITPIIPVHEIRVGIVITKKGVKFSEINVANLI